MVTGAAGFVGRHIVDALIGRQHEVVALDKMPLPLGDELPCPYELTDVCDPTALGRVARGWRPDVVVHGAAATPDAETERIAPEPVIGINESGTVTALRAAAQAGARRFILLSSAAVYRDRGPDRTLGEDIAADSDITLYALTKRQAERLSLYFGPKVAIDVRVARLGPVYGRHERPTVSRSRMSLIYRAVDLIQRGEEIVCAVPEARHDWVQGDDAGRAIEMLASAEALRHDIYNVAGPGVAVRALLDSLTSLWTGSTVRWTSDASEATLDVPERWRRSMLDTSRIRSELGWLPETSFSDGLRDVYSAIERMNA